MKYFVFSIDDGTVFDQKTIQILNKYGFKGTFNLNSGMDDYVWFYGGKKEVRRLILKDHIDLYEGHEVASHSLNHTHLTATPDKFVYIEAYQDICNLEELFKQKVTTFAFPFEDYDERCINIIKNIKNIKTIRISSIDESFQLPQDLYHVKITAWDINKALHLIKNFQKDENAKLFVFVAHSYDFEFDSTYDKLEKLCQIIKKDKNIKVITMNEIANIKSL